MPDSESIAPMALRPQAPLAQTSRFYQRLQRRYGPDLALLSPGAPTRERMEAALAALLARPGTDALAVALRVLRQMVLARLIERDCDGQAPLQEITTAMTELAEIALDRALQQVRAELDARHGSPQGPGGEAVALWIVGMGKLGARELNVSSDIDLIYVYEAEGETAGRSDGRGKISHHEYFARAVKAIYALIGETTEHGFVFRVDLALRPHGNSGPAAIGLPALEDYLQSQGREWERFAWLKSRVVAPLLSTKSDEVQGLRNAVLPFVFRRYLDYSVFDALRVLHRQIRDHAVQRSAGRPQRSNDVKLSRGGIREIEFIVQLLQVVRGGQFPELRCRSTLDALGRLSRAGLMAPETAAQLGAAYGFLRQVEHRIQYLDDQQTHVLPTDDQDLDWIAQTLGLSPCAFLHQLDAHRELVAQEFDDLLGGREEKTCQQCGVRRAAPEPGLGLEALLEALTPALRDRVAHWRSHARVQALRDEARGRLLSLVQRTGQWVQMGRVPELSALRLIDWLESLLRRESYLALLLERPVVHERLLHMLGAARWPARYLLQHPGVIDELAGEALFHERFDSAQFEHELQVRRTALASTGEDDDENLLDLLRRAHHAEMFRTLARDIEGHLSVEQVADDLSLLADSVLRVTAQWCWERLKTRHREQPCFAIIGYGKLGGKELGYGSDLDIVFVFDDDDERSPEIYTAFVRKLINWLAVKTSEGDLFEIDTQLRPNGNSGLLVTSFTAYAAYQQQRGSNTAWTWEHQAMTRARFVLGSAALGQRFDAVREAVITAERDQRALAGEIAAMRERVRAAHPVRGDDFDVKHSRGAMVDAEFAVQYLVLAHSRHHSELRGNLGNIALLQRAQAVGLLPPGVGDKAADAYRELRRIQHQARLDEVPQQVPLAQVGAHREAVLALWDVVFGQALGEILPPGSR